MAVIDKVGTNQVDAFGVGDAFGDILTWFRALVSDEMWEWYDAHRNDPLVTVGVWIFSYSVKVRHVKPLFVKLFGPRS